MSFAQYHYLFLTLFTFCFAQVSYASTEPGRKQQSRRNTISLELIELGAGFIHEEDLNGQILSSEERSFGLLSTDLTGGDIRIKYELGIRDALYESVSFEFRTAQYQITYLNDFDEIQKESQQAYGFGLGYTGYLSRNFEKGGFMNLMAGFTTGVFESDDFEILTESIRRSVYDAQISVGYKYTWDSGFTLITSLGPVAVLEQTSPEQPFSKILSYGLVSNLSMGWTF